MRILSLKLQNIGRHEHLYWEFQPGLIGIFGPNGSGKSSAIDAGAYAALTNDFGRVVGGKEGAIRQQAESHEPAVITLKAEHQGTEFEITRTLQPGSKHKLTSSALPKPITKAGEIKVWVEETLGLNRSLIDDYLFVGQRDLTAPFNASAVVRAKSLSRLCKTMHAEKCWEALGKQLEADRPLAGQVIDTSDGIRKRIGEYKTKLKQAKGEHKKAKEGVLSNAKRLAAEGVIKKRERQDLVSAELEQAEKRGLLLLTMTREAFTKAKDSETLCDRAEDDREKKACLAQVAEQKIKSYRQDLKAWLRRQQCAEHLEALQGKDISLPEKPACADDVEKNREVWTAAKVDVSRCKKWINAIEFGAGACDSCGAPMDSIATKERLAKCETELPVYEQSVQDHHALILAGQDYKHHLRDALADRENHERLLQQAQAALDACGSVEKPKKVDEESQQELVAAATTAHELLHGNKSKSIIGLLAGLRALDKSKNELKGQHKAAKTRADELEKEVAENEFTDEQVLKCERMLKRDEISRQLAAAAQALLDAHQTSLNEQREELERVQTLLSRSVRAGTWMKLQERMREVLHRDRLPRRVHRRALHRMESGVNGILEQFDSPFWVRTDDELRFVAYFPDGTIMPAEGLSGGEQSVLALAFRWTLNSLFASQVGMLVLDEPTAWIDTRNLDCLEKALTNLRGLVQSQGYQVIIITHHQQLQRVFDQVITLE